MGEKPNPSTAEFKKKLYNEAYDTLLVFRKENKQSAEKHSFFLDKAILTISTAGIGALLTLHNNFEALNMCGIQLALMILSFIFFTVSIASVLFSFYSIQKVFSNTEKIISPWYQKVLLLIDDIDINLSIENQKERISKAGINPELDTFWMKATKSSNLIASICVWLAILTGISFFLATILI